MAHEIEIFELDVLTTFSFIASAEISAKNNFESEFEEVCEN